VPWTSCEEHSGHMTIHLRHPLKASATATCDRVERLDWPYGVMDGYPGIVVPATTELDHRRSVMIEIVSSDVQWGEEADALLSVVTIAAAKPNLTEAVMRALLKANWSRAFGRFSIDSDGDVTLRHELDESDSYEAQLQEAITQVFSDACGFDAEVLR
jgi:Putative bacterial sensory transduction regulator